MFLYLLKDDSKQAFIELCRYAAEADNVLETRETETIAMYCREMGITEEVSKGKRSLDIILEELTQKTDELEKRIILFELLGLLFSDEKYSEQERTFVERFMEKCGIERQLMSRMCSLLEIYKVVYKEIYLTVCI